MNKIEEALWKDYKDIQNIIDDLSIESDEYEKAIKERDNIRNELIKLKQIDEETYTKTLQVESENKREKIRNWVAIGTSTATIGSSLLIAFKTFKFDEVSTVTSTVGRSTLNGFISKLFKR